MHPKEPEKKAGNSDKKATTENVELATCDINVGGIRFTKSKNGGENGITLLGDTLKFVGDIIISVDKVLEQAQSYGHSPKREFAFLIVHSMLHLFGYDHIDPKDAAIMEPKQKQILEEMHIVRD